MKRSATWLRATVSSVKADAPLAVVLLAMLVLGIFLRVHHLGVPTVMKWDEHHYVDVARSYVGHHYATDDHPPFGKLIIAGVMALLGDSAFAWRLAPLLFGFANIGLIAWATRITFKSTRAALLAGAFVAADGFFIAYSRAALLDGMIVAFALAGVSTIIVAEKLWQVVLAAVLVGCAASFKLNGVTFVAVAALVCVVRPRLRRWTPVLLLVAAFVFYAQSAFALWFTGGSGSVRAVIAENLKLARHHLSYTVVHPWSSHWYTWFLPLRPLALWRDFDPTDNALHTLVTLGNPLLWWTSTLAVIAIIWVLVRIGPRRLWRRTQGQPDLAPEPPSSPGGLLAEVLAVEDRALPLLWILAAWTAPLAFWVPSLRDAYLYHYLPSYTFALVLLAGLVDRFYSRRRFATFVAIILVAEISFFYAPIWGELPISQEALNVRLFIPAWR